jgi:hypothetical protein
MLVEREWRGRAPYSTDLYPSYPVIVSFLLLHPRFLELRKYHFLPRSIFKVCSSVPVVPIFVAKVLVFLSNILPLDFHIRRRSLGRSGIVGQIHDGHANNSYDIFQTVARTLHTITVSDHDGAQP